MLNILQGEKVKDTTVDKTFFAKDENKNQNK